MMNNSNKPNLTQQEKEEVLSAALKKFGFLFPETEKEIEDFENIFGSTEIDLPADLCKGDFIIEALQQPSKKEVKNVPEAKVVPFEKPSNVDYYRRTLLAAEIVHELQTEMTLGHLKVQKLIFLAQKTEQLDLPVNFLKQAMGPYDPRLMRSIDKQLLIKKWFQFLPSEKLKYKPLECAGQHKDAFNKYYGNEKEKIHWLIDTFRKVKSNRVEIIATLFACWEELLNEGKEASNDNLSTKFFAWSTLKQKFNKEDVIKEIPWMIDNKLFPKN